MNSENNINKFMRLKIVEHFGTQERLASISGIDEGIISKLVRNIRAPTDDQGKILTKLLKCTKKELFPDNI
uniref:Putative DNA binding, helix-turn-helix domain containing protein n=1 Tax=viral metagenome TaxID=1070528 RepID=A0A6M3L617_9ZZZZ